MAEKRYPEPIAGAFIKNPEGKILLVKSDKWGGKVWTVPGGHIEWGESIEDAARREVKEEVGLIVSKVRVFHLFEAIFPRLFKRKKHFIFIECECFVEDSEFKIDKTEIQEARWFSFEELESLQLEDFTKRSLQALAGENKIT